MNGVANPYEEWRRVPPEDRAAVYDGLRSVLAMLSERGDAEDRRRAVVAAIAVLGAAALDPTEAA